MIKKKYKFPSHKFKFLPGFKDLFIIKDLESPSKWIESNFILTRSYATQGQIKLFPWQIPIVNTILEYKKIIFIGSVQTGKSLLCECIIAYLIVNIRLNMLLIYEKKEKVEAVFDERLKMMIMEIPALRKYWSGVKDDLTKKKIKLSHMILRIGSAGVEHDISTFASGVVYGSELAKWPKKSFSQIKMIEGRLQSSRMMGAKTITLLETSPRLEGDLAYIEAHKPDVRYCKPFYKCIHCEEWILFEDKWIKEQLNKFGKTDHSFQRIKKDKAAIYYCYKCGEQITEADRLKMSFKVVYAAINKNKYEKDELIEKILPDGTIKNKIETDTICINWNRLVDTTWTFADCLSAFFEASQSANPVDLLTYQNEDMARWLKTDKARMSSRVLYNKIQKYYMFGEEAFVPDDIVIALIAIDSMDTDFHYVIRGYGYGMKTWLLQCGVVKCDKKDDEFRNPQNVFKHLHKEITQFPLKKKDGTVVPIFSGLIDSGGHRINDVNAIVRQWSIMQAYKGGALTEKGLIYTNYNSGIIHGWAEGLSKSVHDILNHESFFLPEDITSNYIKQVRNQFEKTEMDSKGKEKKFWESIDPDHYRDCENMLFGLTILLKLKEKLFDFSTSENMKNNIEGKNKNKIKGDIKKVAEEMRPQIASSVSSLRKEMQMHGFR